MQYEDCSAPGGQALLSKVENWNFYKSYNYKSLKSSKTSDVPVHTVKSPLTQELNLSLSCSQQRQSKVGRPVHGSTMGIVLTLLFLLIRRSGRCLGSLV